MQHVNLQMQDATSYLRTALDMRIISSRQQESFRMFSSAMQPVQRRILRRLDNFHNAFASIYEGRYLAGVAAGMKLNEMIDRW